MLATKIDNCRHTKTRSAICPAFSARPARATICSISAGVIGGTGTLGRTGMRSAAVRNDGATLFSSVRTGKGVGRINRCEIKTRTRLAIENMNLLSGQHDG